MRQFYKKISSVCMALLCVAALLIGCTATAWAADEIDDSVKSQLVTTTKGLTDAIIAMSEDDIQGYLESEDAFTQSAASAWDGSREELGEKKGDINEKDITVEYSDDQYTVVVPVSFEKNKANFTYVFDKSGTPTSLTVDVNYTLAQNMEKAAMNTVMVLGTVFCDPGIPDLRDLSFQIYSRTCGRKEKREHTGSGSRSTGSGCSTSC